ncbi:RNA polymerase sigma factor [Paraglaciecola arctica]|uniref:Sigma-70, region 4 type 2 n=1 Tax=Paraglaciecola arctica BSs20135 TaxID=493475 RepID=K6YMJ2_9ALTE|nr:RNA polymerase sigma factor [Paraglaciecola arctica]GAC17838.1 sigma-70, region 4 type 2 [Paraglaciecola arctica BSs20135]
MKKDDELRAEDASSHSKANKNAVPRFSILAEFRNNQLSLRNFIARYMVSSHDIEDVSQETFLRAYKVEKERKIDFPKAFLFRIAKNLMLSEFSRKTRKITDYIDDCDEFDAAFNTETLESDAMAQQKVGIYCEAVAALPAQCRRVIIMKKVYGMQNKEIARRLELSVSTVEKHLSKGIKQSNAIISQRYSGEKMTSRVDGKHSEAQVFDVRREK